MKALIFAWNIIGLANSLGIVSKSVVRSVNPQTYTAYCVYSEEEINNNNLAGSKHIITCGSLNCEYYRRMCYNAGGAGVGAATTVGTSTTVIGVGSTIAETTFPIIGGLSATNLALAACIVTPILGLSLAVVATGTYLIAKGTEDTIRGIENELKLKWENEQKEARINNLQNELINAKKKLTEAIKKRDEYRNERDESTGDYLREKVRAEELENQIRELKIRLCGLEGCGCGGNCINLQE